MSQTFFLLLIWNTARGKGHFEKLLEWAMFQYKDAQSSKKYKLNFTVQADQ